MQQQESSKSEALKSSNILEYDFLVIGGGTMGISTALYLSLEYPGLKTALIEQYEIGHKEGASHSETRIIRSTYGHEFYRDLCIECKENYWPNVEQVLGQKILFPSPYLAFIEEPKLYQSYKRCASTSTTTKEISVEEAEAKFPHIPKIKTCKSAFYEEGAQLVMAAKYLSGVRNYLIQKKNVHVYENCEVQQFSNDENGSVVSAKTKEFSIIFKGKKVALCCGRWITKLAPVTADLLLNVKQVVTYWNMKDPSKFKMGQFPSYINIQKNGDFCYVIPDGKDGDVKYLIYINDQSYWHTNFNTDEEYQKASIDYMRKKMEYHYGDQADDISTVNNCWYSFTKNEDFLIDWTDQHKNVLIVSACSGHGFKFSPIIGKIATDILCKDKTIEIWEKYRHNTTLDHLVQISKDNKVPWF